MKEQARQYQVTVFLKKGTDTKQFKSKKKAMAWAAAQKNAVDYKLETVK